MTLQDLAEQAVKRADAIGCCHSTQAGEMPSPEEVLGAIVRQATERPWPKSAAEAHERFKAIAAEALFGALLTAPSEPGKSG